MAVAYEHSFLITSEVIEMTNENIENIVKIDSKSFADMCKQIIELEEENKSIKLDNDFLQRQNNALKLRCSKYAIEIRELTDEVNDLRFTHKYLTSEEAGKQFAQELLGVGQ